MKQAVDFDLFLYVDDSCLISQHKNVSKMEQNLNKNFSNTCDWFVNDKLSIHFGEDITKCILFGTKQKLNKTDSLNIRHGTIQIKQYHTVTYLGCALDENLSRETTALKVISKINCRLRFLYRKNRFLSQPLLRLLCNALIQPHFDYACSAWYPNLNNRLKSKLQTLQNKCIRFCLNLDSKAHMGLTEFGKINWLPINYRFEQCISSMTFKYFNYLSSLYWNDVFKLADQNTTATRTSLFKLSETLRSNHGQKRLSYVAPSIWDKLPDFLKTTDNVNTYKHRVKKHFFQRMNNEESNIYSYF